MKTSSEPLWKCIRCKPNVFRHTPSANT